MQKRCVKTARCPAAAGAVGCRVRSARPRPVRPCRSGNNATESDLRHVLEQLMERQNLSEQQTSEALQALVTGAEPAQIGAFLVLLRAKGETAEEIAGMARAMRSLAVAVETPYDVLDIVGTGGDGIGSVNISTGATVISAAAGAKVAKHGNRSVSSLCGSADVLEALGVAVDIGPEGVRRCIDEAGVGFMFAPAYHPAMKTVVPVRKALKVRTAFNLLGPMLNPADAHYGLVGVYSTSVSHLMADALQRLGVKKALVVHSMGLDELTPMGPADVVEVTQQGKRSYQLEPRDLGIPRCSVQDLAGGDAALNAQILMDVFGGAQGPVADALNLNAGVALAAATVAADAKEGVAMAQEAQRSGRAGDTMRKWLEVSQAARAAELAAMAQ
ncbi:anthranilate phosphoribosyltransferase [Chlorella sorokiniana]|uniref:anthranilate phosphoribosyltransferase n=1 Tax=Chlorella sorokiniana TaxID=3076 RepID=A0A2P6U405_CHLSO|nr:anthranilate phosphoribosyltransferase [Chlorella sorokiniana]|eukprot:PRW61048.1 anthranilate phosphoribosyltransferase [Chlorella sorokiniana]